MEEDAYPGAVAVDPLDDLIAEVAVREAIIMPARLSVRCIRNHQMEMVSAIQKGMRIGAISIPDAYVLYDLVWDLGARAFAAPPGLEPW